MSSIDASKRAFFRGKIQASSQHIITPPWSVANFSELCQACDDCISACEEYILIKGEDGLPQVDFTKGECTFCEACVQSCDYGALDLSLAEPWYLKAVIDNNCFSEKAVYCRTCDDSCDQQAIQFKLKTGGRSSPEISLNLCNGCGACFAVCPGKAIQIQEAS